MTNPLRVTDNTTTVSLFDGNQYLGSYVPRVSIDGDVLQERLTVGFTSSISTIRSTINSLNRLFLQAKNYTETETGARVYVEFDPGNTGTYYRSRLYSGSVNLNKDTLGNQWGASNLELDIEWTRQGFWEGALTELPLSNTSASGTTDGITINNVDDASGENWCTIASSDIDGDLHAPVKIQMVNATTDAANPTDEIYINHNVYSNPTAFVHTIEGESSTDASSTTDAGSSSSAYGAFTWATTDETKIAEWPIASSDLDDAAGGRFSIMARWPAVFPYTDCWLRFKLETSTNYSTLWTGNLSLPAPSTDAQDQRELNQIDTMRLPPYLAGQSSIKGIVLSLYALRGSTDNTINIDYLQLAPISGMTGWKRFVSVDQGIGIDETFIHDAIEDFTYKQDSSGDAIAEFTEYGGPIMLVPNVDQRLYFLTCDNAGAAEITQSWTVKAWYRPRRNSL